VTGETWRHLLGRVGGVLPKPGEAWHLVEEASGWDRAQLVGHLDEEVPGRARTYFDAMVARRLGGEPLQYVVGQWGFRRLDLLVDRRVLIPRPETEMVAEVAIGELRRLVPRDRPVPPLVADVGTGSGAIALAVADEVTRALVWGIDVSADALAVARANLAGAGSLVGPRVRLLNGSWLEPLPETLRGHLDLVVSNPPYLGADEELPAEVADWEPVGALVSGPTGLEGIDAVVSGAARWLARPGAVVVEIAPHQAREAAGLAAGAGFDHVEVRADLADRPRVLVGRYGA
jgi:release factor glutamine methyltransferase